MFCKALFAMTTFLNVIFVTLNLFLGYRKEKRRRSGDLFVTTDRKVLPVIAVTMDG